MEVPKMGIRERALEAKALADRQTAEDEAREDARRIQELRRQLYALLGDDIVIQDDGIVAPKTPVAIVDGLWFGLQFNHVSWREQLVLFFACKECGDLGSAHMLWDLASLGAAIEQSDSYICQPCWLMNARDVPDA